ncbi:kinesin-like protein KIF20B isoform X2 [Tyto alba]|uniref:kinesin-like protein KIF20B isoform X2 n=1 Tax=Tyto alba TaxID=56313 RepID=UPI001C675D3C|nr:kinesin-like protein KIF20B isoform X2 [Tyto alba]
MELTLDNEKIFRPSYVASVEPQRTGPINVEDLKADLSAEFSLVSSSSDTSQRSSLDSKGHIQVCLRIRPFTSLERENELQNCVSLEDSTSIILKPPKNSLSRLSEKSAGQMIQKFTFSRVFGPETTQEEFFEGTMKQPVQDFLDGYNRLIFTYGVTNAGKTYTFQGTEDDIGILPRTMDMLFKSIQGKLYTAMDLKPYRCRDYIKLTKDQVREETTIKNSILRLTKEVDHQNSTNNKAPIDSNDLEELLKDSEQSSTTVKNDMKFSVWVSFFEIYNECFYDLLIPISNDKKRKTLRLAQDIKGCSYVKDLQWVQISDSKEAFRLLKLGLKHQSIASTKLNTCSSRSHSIFTVKILKIEDSGAPRVTRVNELSMCDLAGSERCTKTRNEGDRLKESGNINTSLLILGKCINALKNCQQSKLQQHIPFRESKLTHFLQGFFSGKGKVYMIVNISQCASAYDETLNVLKFSAIAQKILVMDTSILPQDQSFGQKSRESSLLSHTKMPIPRKRATILWDRSLEDVIEDDDDEVEEQHSMSREEAVQEHEENQVVIGKEEYMTMLSLIEELKNKLITEKKTKLLLELKIREEVTQEFAQYYAEREIDFKECLSQERERLEENSERRLEIFKELVNGFTNNADEEKKLKDQPCSEQAEPLGEEHSLGPGTYSDLEGIFDSLQHDVMDIKNQTEEAHRYIVSLEDRHEAVGWLEKQLGKITTELNQTKEELTKKTNELIKTEEELTQKTKDIEKQMIKLDESAEQLKEATEKMNTQNKRIQELMNIVEQKDDVITRLQELISHLEETVKDYDNTITNIKRKLAEKNSNKVTESSQFKDCEETVLEVGRKRCFENKSTVEEEPPTKKGDVKENWEDDFLEQKRTEYMRTNTSENYAEILALKEKNETLEGQLAALEEQFRREKNKKEEFNAQITNLHLKLSASEERASGLSEELHQCRADYQEIVSELDKQKTINREQEEKIIWLNNKIEGDKQNIIDKVSLIKTMQSKVDELFKCHLESYAMDIDLLNLKDSLDSQKDESESSEMSPVCMQSQTSTADLRHEGSFHCSVETLWEECKNIIKASSQKSQRIQELLQQVEDLKKELDDTDNYNNHRKVKLNETANQDCQSIKEDLTNELQEQIQKKTQGFEKQATKDHRGIAQFEEEVTSYKGKIRELECLLEAFRAKDDSMTKLEEVLKEKESIISNLESNIVALQEECSNSDKKLKELNNQEANLREEIVQLMNSLENMKQSLQEKEKNEDEQIQSMELLRKDLSESSDLVRNLKKDLQRKEEEYADLKEKFSDAKKQIQQVEKEVCTMRSEEKSLRNRINELQKIKSQFSEELEIKQRIILQLKKEQVNNEKLEEMSKQYEKTRKDLCAKEKIIEDMRMTLEEQEQTQTEQDKVLEAKLEETNRLVWELEAWKQKYGELNNQSYSDGQQKMSKNEEKNINDNEEIMKLQKELQENEAKYQTDRKKWLEEKMRLISQVKEAESHRNREMRKFAEDRERHVQQQAEVERLAAQLVEKDSNLQKWREERDKLVEALEVQLKTLSSNIIQKDKEIAELKQAAVKDSGKDKETDTEELRKQLAKKDDFIKELKQRINSESNQSLAEVPLPEGQDEIDESVNEKDHSEIVLDSSEVSTENGKTSRFPKPEMEIQFTPLQPNKMEVRHQGSTLPVTVKMLRPRKKRKSEEMDEDFVRSENKKNAKPAMTNSPSTSSKKTMSSTQSFRKEYSLRKQVSTSCKKSAKKKDGTLQKIGDFFQSSPTIIHSKAKKLIATISSPKSAEPEIIKENDLKPKRAKRKLYSTDISCPLDISASSVFIEQREKESDHLIIKRHLRSKPAK